MTEYRMYSVDRGGRIVTIERLIADNDAEAQDLVRALNRPSDSEVWRRTRFVGVVSAWGREV